jgi:hypothetical protein
MRRVAISVVAALLALSALAPVAVADEEPVSIAACVFDGRTYEVDQGQDIRLLCGWSVNARGLVRAYLTSIERTLTLTDEDGNVVWSRGPEDTASDWLAPQWARASDFGDPDYVCHPDVGWWVIWEYFLAPLDPGTYTYTQTDTLRHPVTDGYHQCWYQGERLAPPPSLYRGTTVSTVTIIVGD